MTKSIRFNVLLYLAFPFLWACTPNEINKPIIIPQVEKEFFIAMMEEPGPAPRQLQFTLRSIALQECLNVSIRNQLIWTPSRYRLDILGLGQPSVCIPGSAFAKSEGKIEMPQVGLHNFDILLGNTISNEGLLRVGTQQIALELTSDGGIILSNPVLQRIPEFTIWGYAGFSTPSMVSVAHNFVNEVSARSGIANFVPGNYGHFTIPTGSGVIKIRDSPENISLKPFVFRFTGNLDDIGNLVQQYRQQYGGNLELRVQAITGETF
jgi:hypothetical protein